ncbi:MAG: hypothetical protein K2N15_10430 [Lachnospiraceae bacterium]|nr:hypothetical protein [Lachnospiraceae bacterium]
MFCIHGRSPGRCKIVEIDDEKLYTIRKDVYPQIAAYLEGEKREKEE